MKKTKYDLIVIGGGPAGMILAGRAGENDLRVLLLEKNQSLGAKLLITGKGRCNITNAEFDNHNFAKKFGKKSRFLLPSLYNFGPENVIDFFKKKEVPIKIERGNRVFPKSDKSKDVLNALLDYLKENKVEIKTNSKVKSIILNNNKIEKVVLSNNQEFEAEKYAICTGGKSYPLTGSSGDAYFWLKKMGHKVILPEPALVPIILKEKWIKGLQGLSLKNVKISIYQNYKKMDSRFGEALFTNNGLSGPIILDMSKEIGNCLKKRQVELRIDYKPALDFKTLDKRVQKDFKEFKNKLFKNSLNLLLPQKLIPVIVKLSKIDPNKKVNLITQIERKKLIHLLKEFKLQVKKLDGFNKAIITSGGVDLKEIDSQTMQSKIIKNLYFAGEILDLDGPTGGYNLQVCWSTGFTAGSNLT